MSAGGVGGGGGSSCCGSCGVSCVGCESSSSLLCIDGSCWLHASVACAHTWDRVVRVCAERKLARRECGGRTQARMRRTAISCSSTSTAGCVSSERPVARSARSTSTATGGEEAGGSATDASGCASPADPAPAVRVALFVVRGIGRPRAARTASERHPVSACSRLLEAEHVPTRVATAFSPRTTTRECCLPTAFEQPHGTSSTIIFPCKCARASSSDNLRQP